MRNPNPLSRAAGTVSLVCCALLGACASLPPGSAAPRFASVALDQPQTTTLGRTFAAEQGVHGTDSAFRIIPVGADGFLLRMQMVRAAERTLDLQYFVFEGDKTGRLLTEALLRAADRGVRVRVLIDDSQNTHGAAQIDLLCAHPSIELRYFNPFAYRGSVTPLHAIEFLFDHDRLDYRMHNKLLIADNAMALVGGRNVGDAYFQIDAEGQFADDDVFAAGPILAPLSAVFDEFWNSPLSIPATALAGRAPSAASLERLRQDLALDETALKDGGLDYAVRISSGEPFNSLLAGRLALVWAHALLVADSPDKKSVENGEMVGRLMRRKVAEAMKAVQGELIMITPYFVPGRGGMELLQGLRQRNVRVRVLTNSLESSTELLAQSAYMEYREALLACGVELFEIRALLGNVRGSGETVAISHAGNYSLHAKLFVFDRRRIFIGSMNFDQRSLHLNTEIGLLIDSPALADQLAARFDAMTRPVNAYAVLAPSTTGRAGLVWRTEEDGKTLEYVQEPARSIWQRIAARILGWLPLDREL